MRSACFFAGALLAAVVSAKDIHVQVGDADPSAADNSTVFNPQVITAKLGDTVIFNFTSGNHSATQSLFASPCIPAHLADASVNGFSSGQRIVGKNSTAIEILPVPILKENENQTFWFFDYNTCATGGVGVININTTNDETIDGFARNAARLNGTGEDSSSSSSSSSSRTSTASSGSATKTPGNGVEKSAIVGIMAAVPLLLSGLALAL